MDMSVVKTRFGITSSGEEVYKYTIHNQQGASISVLNYGAILQSVCVPDEKGNLIDVVLGFDTIEQYEVNPPFFGAVIGRSGNRIANARFDISGVEYKMTPNENENNLHSGPDGYEKRIWEVQEAELEHVSLALLSPDGDQGFPGDFSVCVTYTLDEDNRVKINYKGNCDQDTVANMTNHSYFNLDGHASGISLNQSLWINADNFTPVKDSKSIPTGEICSVINTPMDFTKEKPIGENMDLEYEQLGFTGGYDHNYVLNEQNGSVRLVARAKAVHTNIVMEVYTDTPGVQFYAGNFVDVCEGKDGAVYGKNHGYCLETQFYPNAVNEPKFPSPILKKNQIYDTTTIYHFI